MTCILTKKIEYIIYKNFYEFLSILTPDNGIWFGRSDGNKPFITSLVSGIIGVCKSLNTFKFKKKYYLEIF